MSDEAPLLASGLAGVIQAMMDRRIDIWKRVSYAYLVISMLTIDISRLRSNQSVIEHARRVVETLNDSMPPGSPRLEPPGQDLYEWWKHVTRYREDEDPDEWVFRVALAGLVGVSAVRVMGGGGGGCGAQEA